VRIERLLLASTNDPFTGFDAFDGSPGIFPNKYLFFDRLDNPTREFVPAPPPGTTFNDQILGIDVPVTNGFVDLIDREQILELVNGRLERTRALPAAGFSWSGIEGLSLRGAYSQTLARPSFREIGYYVSISDDLVVGNPQLETSLVESFDLRLEYTRDEDLFAVSGFYKTVDDPIEGIVVRDAANFDSTSAALYRTFFNNPNQAELLGIEVEARKRIDFLPSSWPGVAFLETFSLGGDFTYIDASVARTQVEIDRARDFFELAPGDTRRFDQLDEKRRLFGQPEWIANADLTFDHPDWGTRVTLALFWISDVLDSAGSASLGPDGNARALTLDRYIDEFHQLDFVLSQELWAGFAFKMSVKNLTDSKRGIVYDPNQTRGTIRERRYEVGRDYSFSIGYTQTF